MLLTLTLTATLLPVSGQTATEAEAESEPKVMQGYLIQTALTKEGFLITNQEELNAFVQLLPKVKPYKKLPAPPNPDPFLKGFTVDFEENLLVVSVGLNRISGFPEYKGLRELENGDREVHFTVPAPVTHAYPFGWALYSAVIVARTSGETRVIVETLKAEPSW